MVIFLDETYGVVQHQRQHTVCQLVAVRCIDHVTTQGKPAQPTTVETMHAVERCARLLAVLEHLGVNLQLVGRHRQAQQLRMGTRLGQINPYEAVPWCHALLVGVQHTHRPGITGKGQPGTVVFVGVDRDEGRGNIVVFLRTFFRQWPRWASWGRIGVKASQMALCADGVGLPDLLVKQDIQVAHA